MAVETSRRSKDRSPSCRGKRLRANYVLIDYESVQPDDLTRIEQDQFKILVFVGATQTKVPFGFAAALQRMGSNAGIHQDFANGPNAARIFTLPSTIGSIVSKHPAARFHIVSKDTGFDPLIHHLNEKRIFATRVNDISEITIAKAEIISVKPTKATSEPLELVISRIECS